MGLFGQTTGEKIERTFQFLVTERGYDLVANSSWGMGGRVTYRSVPLWIALEWDRSDPWLEFMPSGTADTYGWEAVDLCLRGASAPEDAPPYMRTSPVPMLATFLRTNLDAIEARFASGSRAAFVACLVEQQRARQRRAEAWIASMSRPRSSAR